MIISMGKAAVLAVIFTLDELLKLSIRSMGVVAMSALVYAVHTLQYG